VVFELFATRNPFYESEPNLMWENIKSCSINWCPNMPYLLKDLISAILVLEPTKRPSLDAIKKHELFSVTFSLENTLG
jgi:serine/threonine protein kinase